jgi:hypothetical protein
VSIRDIPAANRIGRQTIAKSGKSLAATPPARTSSATSVAVSNPSPNRQPTTYMCEGLPTARVAQPKKRAMTPRERSRRSSSSSVTSPFRISPRVAMMLTRMVRLRIPIRRRNEPDSAGPIALVASCKPDPSSATAPLNPRTPRVTIRASNSTTVECPSEKKKPTLRGRCPSLISLRVELSIAPMWSASKACRSPST